MVDVTMRVEGIREFSRAVAAAGPDLRRQLGRTYKEVGQKFVPKMQERMRREGKGRGGTLGAAGIKASARSTALAILLSGSNPRTLGDEFGALTYPQFRGWRGSGEHAGYAVYPTIRENQEEILDAFFAAVERAAAGAFPTGSR